MTEPQVMKEVLEAVQVAIVLNVVGRLLDLLGVILMAVIIRLLIRGEIRLHGLEQREKR